MKEKGNDVFLHCKTLGDCFEHVQVALLNFVKRIFFFYNFTLDGKKLQ